MIAAFVTIAFLGAAWVAMVAIAGSLEENFASVSAALRGQLPDVPPAPVAVRISQRYPTACSKRIPARPSMRAAA